MHKQIARTVKPLLGRQAVILALTGPLGAGKTTFTKALAKELGITETVTSPTFVLHTEYRIPARNATHSAAGGPGTEYSLHHIDAWRLETADELRQLGLDQMLANKSLMIIEWADKFADFINQYKDINKVIWIRFAYGEKENERTISLTHPL